MSGCRSKLNPVVCIVPDYPYYVRHYGCHFNTREVRRLSFVITLHQPHCLLKNLVLNICCIFSVFLYCPITDAADKVSVTRTIKNLLK